MLRSTLLAAVAALIPVAASAQVPCYNFGGDPAGCNAQPGCYWDNYGQICAQQFNPTPVPLTLTSTCISNGPPATCPVAGRILGVQLVQQLPGGPCIPGQTWTYDASNVYVTDGCRAYFTVTYVPFY